VTKKTKYTNYAAFPLVFAYVFDVVCNAIDRFVKTICFCIFVVSHFHFNEQLGTGKERDKDKEGPREESLNM
jgi:hypothetical protein